MKLKRIKMKLKKLQEQIEQIEKEKQKVYSFNFYLIYLLYVILFNLQWNMQRQIAVEALWRLRNAQNMADGGQICEDIQIDFLNKKTEKRHYFFFFNIFNC